jgi:Lon protease-like protein
VTGGWADLPLFPLNTVLFPGQVLPLHIFEARYRVMVDRCIDQDRAFGVVLIHKGLEVGGAAEPHEVGTTANIIGTRRMHDGRINLVTVGSERFRLRSIRTDLPYLTGDAEAWPLASNSVRARLQVVPVSVLFRRYLDLLDEAQGSTIEVEDIPIEPRELALLVAITMRLPLPQKQHLLMQRTVDEMLRAEHKLLNREKMILEQIARTQDRQREGGYSGFLAQN